MVGGEVKFLLARGGLDVKFAVQVEALLRVAAFLQGQRSGVQGDLRQGGAGAAGALQKELAVDVFRIPGQGGEGADVPAHGVIVLADGAFPFQAGGENVPVVQRGGKALHGEEEAVVVGKRAFQQRLAVQLAVALLLHGQVGVVKGELPDARQIFLGGIEKGLAGQ